MRTPDDLYYADEIGGPETTLVYTRATPPGFARLPARLRADDLPRPIDPGATAFVCGSSGFADAASDVLAAAGIPDRGSGSSGSAQWLTSGDADCRADRPLDPSMAQVRLPLV